MAAQKGLDVLMKIDISGTKTTIGGLRSTSITLNDESVDVTNKDSLGSRTLLAGAGVNSLSISGSGVFTDSAAEVAVRTAFQAQQNTSDGSSGQTAAFESFQFRIPNLGTYTGNFQITSLEYAGEYNGEATYSMSFESAGYITFAAE
ncbi:MAG: phage major tail protein, TP901-1 family [Phycisphaerae bacterium]|nr:phage major tail protein, TP901-1 family [Phycisphaerae bacterium]|tara:strand:- start:21 stop:461 length:441 start_codon:yes stop_codon:yes gene_type:complete